MSTSIQNKRDEHILKRRNVPMQDSTDSEDSEKPLNQSLDTIVKNVSSSEPTVQLSAVQAARYVSVYGMKAVTYIKVI